MVPAHREGVLCEPTRKGEDKRSARYISEEMLLTGCAPGLAGKLTVGEEGVCKVEGPYEAGEGVIGRASLDFPLDGSQLHLCQFSLQTSVCLLELLTETMRNMRQRTNTEAAAEFRYPTFEPEVT